MSTRENPSKSTTEDSINQVRWPNGHKAAICLTWDFDGEAAFYLREPTRAENQLSDLHQRAHGPRKAIWRVLSLLDAYAIRGTFFIPAYIAEAHSSAVTAIANAGHAIGLHGYLHETMENLDRATEREILLRSQAVFEDVIGFKPSIYRAPSWELNRWTPELLLENGMLSDSSLMDDEAPYGLKASNGTLVEIPIQWILDDAEYWGHFRSNRDKSIADPDTVVRIWSREFDGYYANGGCFVLTLHDIISGRWVYLEAIERFIKYLRGFPDVWWTTIDDVTSHCLSLLASDDLPLREMVPPRPHQRKR